MSLLHISLIEKQAQDVKLLLAHKFWAWAGYVFKQTFQYKYLITLNVLQRKIETVSN